MGSESWTYFEVASLTILIASGVMAIRDGTATVIVSNAGIGRRI